MIRVRFQIGEISVPYARHLLLLNYIIRFDPPHRRTLCGAHIVSLTPARGLSTRSGRATTVMLPVVAPCPVIFNGCQRGLCKCATAAVPDLPGATTASYARLPSSYTREFNLTYTVLWNRHSSPEMHLGPELLLEPRFVGAGTLTHRVATDWCNVHLPLCPIQAVACFDCRHAAASSRMRQGC